MRLLALLSLAVLTAACRPPGSAAGQKYETAPVTRGTIVQYATATGTLSAVISVDVGSQVSGKIAALYADFNSPVKKGQLIAEIDTTVYKAQLQQAQGDLASAKATVVLKRQNLERKKILAPQHAASQLDLDQAVSELAQAEATVVIKEAALESARANLGYCKITSPVDGIVISRKVDAGQTVAAAMSTPILFTIAQDITKMHISAAVSEADIGSVKVGEPVDFNVDAFPEQIFHGTVAQVRMAPTTTQNVVTYETIIDVANPDKKLFPGMTADVSILIARRTDVLKIPNAALRFSPATDTPIAQTTAKQLDRGQRLVYVPDGPGPGLKAVVCRVGISDGVDTEIVDGLTAGSRVVTTTTTNSLRGGVRFGAGGPPPG